MCGRYAASANPDELVEEFEIESDQTGGALRPDYNVAPTVVAPVVLSRVPGERRDEPDAVPVRQLRLLTWGLVPSWSKTRTGGAAMINARVESLFSKPAFRRAAATRRALVPADGWYEWARRPGAPARGPKQPFYVTRRDAERVALAGIYEFWKDPSAEPDDPDAWLTTFAVLTTAAEPGLAHLHERMPVVLDREQWAGWLEPGVQGQASVEALLGAAHPGRFTAVPVSALVSNVRNNGPELTAPVEVEGALLEGTTGELWDEPLPGL